MNAVFPQPVCPEMTAVWAARGKLLIQDGRDSPILQVYLCIHDEEDVNIQYAGGLGLLRDLQRHTFRRVLDSSSRTVELIVITGPQVKPQGVLAREVLGERHIRQGEVFRDHKYHGVPFGAACVKLSGLVPLLVCAQALRLDLVRDALDGNVNFRSLGVVEGLRVALKGSRGVNKEQQDSLHGARWGVDVDVPDCVALISAELAVPEDTLVEDRQAAGVLGADQSGEFGVGDLIEL